MKKTVLSLFLVFLLNLSAWADVPKYISFQGELTDSQGTRITSSKTVTFAVYKAASGGAALWSEGQTLTPANGIVSASIGSATAGGVTLAFDTGYWLGVTVSPDAEMSPRIRLTTSPYAFIAKYLDTGAAAYGALSVAETVTASKFVGDGSLLTGITASGAADTDWTIATTSTIYRLSGNVGIGTASPADSLHVVGTVRVSDSITVGDTVFVVNSKSGNVGIGTASPAKMLHVNEGDIRVSKSSGFSEITFAQGATQKYGAGYSMTGGYFYLDQTGVGTHLVIKDGGNVGIGTTAPADLLHVAGRLMLDTNAAASAADGAIRWSGSDFEGRKGGAWTSFTATGGATPDTDWTVDGGGNVYRSSGNVGIGSTSPGAKLDVVGSVLVSDSMAVGDTRLVVLKSGNVGIGTASPNSKLEVNDASALEFRLTHAANGAVVLRRDGAVGYILTESGIGSNRNLAFGMEPVTGGAVTEWARFDPNGNLGISTTAPGDSLHVNGTLRVEDTMVVGDTWLVVTKAGNVGIGTTAPVSKVEMVGAANTHLRIQNITSGSDAGIRLYNTVGSGREYVINSHSSGYLDFYDLTATQSRMAINSSGNVGIGSTTPGAKLDVVGSVLVSDSMVVGDTRLVVLKSGNVGIGTNAPDHRLVLKNTIAQSLLSLDASNLTNSYSRITYTTDGSQWMAGAYNDARDGFEFSNSTYGPWNTVMLLKDNGNVGIGTTTPTDSLTVNGSIRIDSTTLYVDPATNRVGIGTDTPTALLTLSGGANSDGNTWNNASSRDYKDGIEDLSASEARAAVAALQPKKYVYKNSREEPRLGFIAEDVPDIVAMNDRKSLSSMDLVAALTKVVQDQQAQIEALTEKVSALERK